MVNLIRIPSFAYCSLHSGPIKPASWALSEADCKVCYAALRAAALEKSATTTLSVAFNFVCSLISGNSARTRNPDLPITASKPVHPLTICQVEYNGSVRKPACLCLCKANTVSSTPPQGLRPFGLPYVLAGQASKPVHPLYLDSQCA